MTAIEIPCAPAFESPAAIKRVDNECEGSHRYVAANNENMKKLSTNDQKWLCHRLFKQALSVVKCASISRKVSWYGEWVELAVA